MRRIANYVKGLVIDPEINREFKRGYQQGQLYCVSALGFMPFMAASDIKELAGKGLGVFGIIALIIMVGAILAGIAMAISDGNVSRAKFAFGIAILAGIALPFVKTVLGISGFKVDDIEPNMDF